MIAFAILFAAIAQTPATTLTPLTASEIREGVEPGLGCDFRVEDKSYLVIVLGEALLNPGSGVRHFRLDEDHALAIINHGGSFGDSAYRVLVDRDDAVVSTGEETMARKARLTLRKGDAEQTLAGLWVCGA